ncbi:site-specific integrase [Nonomuraea ferruginea]|uniref:Site-specific integrase n=1 Tax=Nonomuraea ferruginea TaxID=46174 RepID=A0ABT4SRP1_9ACTN|nr:site-specific integrase [Nonomuraea ferruginea]MDA0639832.1 site-specific integrase [Nonomuraea ferruginea]
MGKRSNGEGSIFPYKGGWASYIWVTTPEGKRTRKWAYGKTREETHDKWLKLHDQARKGPVATKHETVAAFLSRWLANVVQPNREPTTYAGYEALVRLYLVPGLGKKRLDKLTVRDVQTWLNTLPALCTCCAQKKQRKKPCCSIGKCCEDHPSRGTIESIRRVFRSALTHAIREELISKNVVALTTLPKMAAKKRKHIVWNVDDARKYLEHLRATDEPLYAAFVLMLVLGLRRGEVLGLTWGSIDLTSQELWVSHQLNRVHGKLLHRDTTKTTDSDASLPLPALCVAALKHRRRVQEDARKEAGERWKDSDLVFTTRYGTPVEPRNFNRSFELHGKAAGVPRIRVHDTRHTCASMLAALDVHPRVAMRILRHSQISVTMNVYTQIASPETRKALDQLNESLDR